jgi:transposase
MGRALNRLVEIKGILKKLRAARRRARETFTDQTIVLIYYWSVLNNQTRAWACDPENWPLKLPPGGLPSESQFSRRFRAARLQRLLDRVEEAVRKIDPPPRDRVCYFKIDGRPLVIGNHSHDPHCGYGRAAGGKARGYRLHEIIDAAGRSVSWRLTPMQGDEREMARRMLRDLAFVGYGFADKSYDSNAVFDAGMERGIQVVGPRRMGKDKGLGHRRQSPARLRSRDHLENTISRFGRDLYATRSDIERVFGTAACTPELLNGLPAWVRTRPRVHRWVQAKLVLAELHRLSLAKKEVA